jgi:hypothetical protein
MTARIRTNKKKGLMLGILFSVLLLQSWTSNEEVTKDRVHIKADLSEIVSSIKNAVKF